MSKRLTLSSFFNIKIFISLILMGFAFTSQAQLFSSTRMKKRNKEIPTIIKSDSMDFDISKNVAVFSGNVQVDDAAMKIFCHKMIINFEGKAKDVAKEKVTKTANKPKSKDGKAKENKTVKEIICLKNVVIIRKLDAEGGKTGEQKALAGKAVYDVKAGKITLTINPELRRGEDLVKGEVIMFWTDSERLTVKNAGEVQIRQKPDED